MSQLSLFLFPFLLLSVLSINDYILTNIVYNEDHTALTANLTYTSEISEIPFDVTKYKIDPLQNATSIKLIKELKLTIDLQCDSILHYVITDENQNRFTPNLTDANYNAYFSRP